MGIAADDLTKAYDLFKSTTATTTKSNVLVRKLQGGLKDVFGQTKNSLI